MCELTSHTKEEKPNHFVTDELRFYMKREGMNYVKVCTPNNNNNNNNNIYYLYCAFSIKYSKAQTHSQLIPSILLNSLSSCQTKLQCYTERTVLEVLRDTYFWYVISKTKRVRLVMSQIHAVSGISKESRPCIDSLKRACLIKK